MVKKIVSIFLIITAQIFADVTMLPLKPSKPLGNIAVPLPVFPDLEDSIGNDKNWVLEKNYTVMLEAKLDVYVPLEIVSDVEIDTVVLDNEELEVPFEINLNKTPDKRDYYKLKYSETEIDIDNDGVIDTFIYSPKYLNSKIEKENYVKIKGSNISKDGYYTKRVYMTIEIDE